LGVSIRHLQSISADEMVLQALRKYKPVLEFAPGSVAARDFRLLAELITQLPPIEQASGRLQFFMGRMLHNAS
jgi:flagellar biosynthesis protein FlhG